MGQDFWHAVTFGLVPGSSGNQPPPEVPAPPPLPAAPDPGSAAAKAEAAAAQEKANRVKTLLTGPQGDPSKASTSKKSLLGQ